MTWKEAREQWKQGWREVAQGSRETVRSLRMVHGFADVHMSPDMEYVSFRGETRPIQGVQAWVEVGFPETYTSGGRVIAGGILAGGLGALVGSLHKRQVYGTGGFIFVRGPGFMWSSQFDSRAEAKARRFAEELSLLGGTL